MNGGGNAKIGDAEAVLEGIGANGGSGGNNFDDELVVAVQSDSRFLLDKSTGLEKDMMKAVNDA